MISELVKSFQPYRVVEGDYRIWLDKNESPFDLPAFIKEEAFDELRELPFNRYPSINSMPLREAVAEFYGLSPGNVAVGNGSDQLIEYLVKLFEGSYLITTPPTFGMYAFYARLEGVPLVEVPLERDFRVNGEAIAERAKNARVIFIASPNNPTGNLQPEEEIIRILETGKPVVVDEAYAEFAGKSLLGLLDDYPNLIILRTFSKAYGLAGVRIGYMLASEAIVDALYRIYPPFPVGLPTMVIAEKALEHRDVMEKRVRYIVEERERMRKALGRLAYPSDANFILVNADAYGFLLERRIVVRRLSGRLEGHIRVTVGRRWENSAFLETMREWLEDVGGL